MTDIRAKRGHISAAASASARLSQKVEAAGSPDQTKGSGRCSPERGCHAETGIEQSKIPFARTIVTNYRTFIDDLYKVLEFVEWYKEWY